MVSGIILHQLVIMSFEIGKSCVGRWSGEERLAEQERGEGHDLGHDERHDAEHDHFGRQYERSPGRGGESGADSSGAVLRAHHEHAQNADGQLAEQQGGQTGAGGIEARPVAR